MRAAGTQPSRPDWSLSPSPSLALLIGEAAMILSSQRRETNGTIQGKHLAWCLVCRKPTKCPLFSHISTAAPGALQPHPHPSFPPEPPERGQSLINSEQPAFVLCVEWARVAPRQACEPALFPPPHGRAGGLQLPAKAWQGLAEEAIEGVMNGCWFRESGRCCRSWDPNTA